MAARPGEIVCPHVWDDGIVDLHFCYLPQDHDESYHVCGCGATAPVESED